MIIVIALVIVKPGAHGKIRAMLELSSRFRLNVSDLIMMNCMISCPSVRGRITLIGFAPHLAGAPNPKP